MSEHAILLRTPGFLGSGSAPVVLRRTDQNFVQGLLQDLVNEHARRGLEALRVPGPDLPDPVLFQPVHRTFEILLVEAVCDRPGYPPLDPRRIQAGGLVVRRERGARPEDTSRRQRWITDVSTGAIRGWVDTRQAQELDDPDPQHRAGRRTGSEAVDRALQLRRTPATEAESTTRMFVAPPDVCEALGTTLLYGVIPTTSTEQASTSSSSDLPEESIATDLPRWFKASHSRVRLPSLLRERTWRVGSTGAIQFQQRRPNGQLSWVDWSSLGHGQEPPSITDPQRLQAGSPALQEVRDFLQLIWMVRHQWDLRADRRPSGPLVAQLSQLQVGQHDLIEFADRLGSVFLTREQPEPGVAGPAVRVPERWSTLTLPVEAHLQQAADDHLVARLQSLKPSLRFDDPSSRYFVRAFVRVSDTSGCPPRIHWTGTEAGPYTIARWYDNAPAGVPVPEIEIPPVSRDFLRNLTPNVAFRVPAPLFDMLRNVTPGDFLDGKAKHDETELDVIWICSLNIPIITICAFIVLFIFLALLNLVFWWLPFVRICIPFPIRRPANA